MTEHRERVLAEQLARAAAARADAHPPSVEVEALVARGLRQRVWHRASLVAAGAAAFALLTVTIIQADPRAIRVPDGGFATQPATTPSPETSGRASTSPSPASRPTASPEPSVEPSPSTAPTTSGIPSEDRCSPAPSIPVPADIEVQLALSETAVARGQQVRMDLRVTNTGTTPVRYEHSAQRYDFWLEDADGAIWLWSADKEFQVPLISDEIAPGDRRDATETWRGETSLCPAGGGGPGPGTSGLDRPPPGRYVARALWLTNQGGWWSNGVEMVVL